MSVAPSRPETAPARLKQQQATNQADEGKLTHKTALNGFKSDIRAPGPVRSPRMVLILLGFNAPRLSRKWSCPFLDFRIFLHDFYHARKNTKTRENPYFGGIRSVGPHVKICTMNIGHI